MIGKSCTPHSTPCSRLAKCCGLQLRVAVTIVKVMLESELGTVEDFVGKFTKQFKKMSSISAC